MLESGTVTFSSQFLGAADPSMLFDADIDSKYERAIRRIGIDPGRLVNDSGHA